MDALKKAEEAKRQSEASGGSSAQEAQPAAADPSASGNGPGPSAESRGLPELPADLELLDHEFHTPPAPKAKEEAAPAAPAPPPPAAQAKEAAQKRERAAAQNVFQAKQAPGKRNAFPLIVGAIIVLAAAGIGIYFWLQLQPAGGLAPPSSAARPGPPPAPIASAPTPPVVADPAPAVQPVPAPPPAAPAAAQPEEKPAAPQERPVAAKAPAKPTPVEPPESPIRITTSKLKLNPQIASAYDALESGDLATAERDYNLALKGEPKNTDALHGLAAVKMRQGQLEAAESYFLRILEADPKDSAAQAGLVNLRSRADPVQSESRLKNLLSSQPDSAAVHFALGNLYAQQGRWNEAQQAYFRAYTSDSDNPDYQFNLAVSLDQLRQAKLALQYYQGALAAAAQRPAAFDRNQVARRVSELQK
jgi:tetratricopeptide (TPR) repeat protein